jgi:hypothetical protein
VRAKTCVYKENGSETWVGVNPSPFKQKEHKEEEEKEGGGATGEGRRQDRTSGYKRRRGVLKTLYTFPQPSKCASVCVCVHVCAHTRVMRAGRVRVRMRANACVLMCVNYSQAMTTCDEFLVVESVLGRHFHFCNNPLGLLRGHERRKPGAHEMEVTFPMHACILLLVFLMHVSSSWSPQDGSSLS